MPPFQEYIWPLSRLFCTSPVKANLLLPSRLSCCSSVFYPCWVKRWRLKTKNAGRAREYACWYVVQHIIVDGERFALWADLLFISGILYWWERIGKSISFYGQDGLLCYEERWALYEWYSVFYHQSYCQFFNFFLPSLIQVMSYAVYSDDVGCEGAVFKSSRQCDEKAEKLKG